MHAAEKRQRTLVKICGVRSPADARAALDAGADAVGVVIAAGSPRGVTPADALQIAQVAGERAVLVLRDPGAETMEFASKWAGPVQFHHPYPRPDRRHIAARGPADSAVADARISAWLLDAPNPGSGTAWEWPAAGRLPTDRPVILAGGLTPDNVASAIRTARPWAVDVSSGVEGARGVKDLALVRRFIDAVRACDLADGGTLGAVPPGFESLR